MSIAAPTQVFGQEHFFEGPQWRILSSDLADDVLTFLDGLAMDRSCTITRGAARVMGFRVPSDNPEVNIPAPDPDADPNVAEGTRLVSFFRREGRDGSFGHRWVIRGRGIALDVTDNADTDHATTVVNAYDPWKYLYRRPVLLDDGSLPGDAGKVYAAGTSWSDIIIDQFTIAEGTGGGTIFTDYGLTAFYGGTIETTDPLPDLGDGTAVKFASGTTLGEMLDQAVASGTCDVVFDPIYDIANRPGTLCEVSIYTRAGALRENAIFGWDKFPRNVVDLSRQILGTERANRVQMYAGQGGPPVPEESDAASIAKFGEYWALQYLPGVPSIAGAHTIAQRQLALLKNGQFTYALTPAAERAPLLFAEYREADTVPLHASRRFRAVIPGHHVRVESIPIVMGDDQLERVNQMLVSYVPETGS